MALRIAERLSERRGDYENQREDRRGYEESRTARAIEKRTARLPSEAFLWASFGAVGASLVMQAAGKKDLSLFIGQWAPTLLALGIYHKMVKLLGSERKSFAEED